jgi:hypothetical protein
MPSASPIATSMFTTKRLSWNAWPITPIRPIATTIESRAITSGIAAPTSVPKTSTRTIRAAGSPNCISPLRRSCSETFVKSWLMVFSPVMWTAKPPAPLARSIVASSSSTDVVAGSFVMTTGRSVACPSRETRIAPPRSRYVATRRTSGWPRSRAASPRTRAANAASRTVRRSERTMTSSSSGSDPGSRSSIRSCARRDSGLEVTPLSLVSALARNALVNPMPRRASNAQMAEHPLRMGGRVHRQAARAEPLPLRRPAHLRRVRAHGSRRLAELMRLRLPGRAERGEPSPAASGRTTAGGEIRSSYARTELPRVARPVRTPCGRRGWSGSHGLSRTRCASSCG